ncbi:CD209 antigen-like protein E [Betta splendens]|uniref:CD209 antigen-like protein E n=1 Tax=Betta splendens TaxID=158456 RepID=A0A9W2XZT8_BETSP|nr:CD209 antigen-like protein E [Betta splendens]XP_055367121.1 CD209 antigen-like protein E [Betta splendens]XP_055367123.1 CD209 antigen-like protein E [Betta splendens]
MINMGENEVYVNVDKPSGAQINWKKRAQSSSGFLYANKYACQAVESNKPGATLSDLEGSNTVKKHTCIVTALILGLLCLLLLAGLLILLVLYTKGNSDWEMKMLKFQTSYNNLTDKNRELQTSYNNLTDKNRELQTSYNNLTDEIHQLQTSYNNLTKEKQQCKLQALNWRYFAGSFYYISSTVKTWQDSRTYCQQFGTDLVIINSLEEQEFIQALPLRVWIGLTDAETEGTWKWVDGTLLGSLSYWAAGEPNDLGGAEDCGEVVWNRYWNDESCDHQDYWICEWVSE